jgi:hypothetical protein
MYFEELITYNCESCELLLQLYNFILIFSVNFKKETIIFVPVNNALE